MTVVFPVLILLLVKQGINPILIPLLQLPQMEVVGVKVEPTPTVQEEQVVLLPQEQAVQVVMVELLVEACFRAAAAVLVAILVLVVKGALGNMVVDQQVLVAQVVAVVALDQSLPITTVLLVVEALVYTG